jgi:hypothetical protein
MKHDKLFDKYAEEIQKTFGVYEVSFKYNALGSGNDQFGSMYNTYKATVKRKDTGVSVEFPMHYGIGHKLPSAVLALYALWNDHGTWINCGRNKAGYESEFGCELSDRMVREFREQVKKAEKLFPAELLDDPWKHLREIFSNENVNINDIDPESIFPHLILRSVMDEAQLPINGHTDTFVNTP